MSKLIRNRNKSLIGRNRARDRIAGRSGGLPPASSPAPPGAVDQAEEPVRCAFEDTEGAGGPDAVDMSRRANTDDDVEALHGEPPQEAP